MLKSYIPGILATAKWTLAFNRWWFLPQLTLQKMSGQDVWTHPPTDLSIIALMINLLFFLSQKSLPLLWVRTPFYGVRSSAPFNDWTTFWLVMMALRWWQNHHHSAGGYQKSWEMTCHHSCHFALQAAECGLWRAVWGNSTWLAFYGQWFEQRIRIRENTVRVKDLRMSCAPLGGSK